MGTFFRNAQPEEEVEYIEPSLFSVVVFYIQEVVRLVIIYYFIALILIGLTWPYKIGEYVGLIVKGFKDATI